MLYNTNCISYIFLMLSLSYCNGFCICKSWLQSEVFILIFNTDQQLSLLAPHPISAGAGAVGSKVVSTPSVSVSVGLILLYDE